MARKRAVDVRPKRGSKSAIMDVAEKYGAFRPASQVLRLVRAVPTRFVQFDHATRVGGLPIDRFGLIHGPSNEGKALEETTPVLTPLGWVPIRDLKVGDRVTGTDGLPHRVEGVFPQGEKELFLVTMSDRTSVRCCDEHLWDTRTVNEKQRGKFARGPRPERKRIPTGVEGGWSTKSLAQIREGFEPLDHELPRYGAIEFEAQGELPLDPYVMGLLLGLGDGAFSQTSINFYKPEEDLHAALAARLPRGDEAHRFDHDPMKASIVGGSTRAILSRLGLLGCRSYEKVIPPEYMRASQEDRLALLRGLIDTDGHVQGKGGVIEFSSSSLKMFKQVAELARSLAFQVMEDPSRMGAYVQDGVRTETRTCARLRIAPNHGVLPFSSRKHRKRWGKTRKENPWGRTIKSIEPCGRAKAVCISVDSPDRRFIVEGFIPTHNTQFCIGLLGSFLDRGHLARLIDAERTTPFSWPRKFIGPVADDQRFGAQRPETYEACQQQVREDLHWLRKQRQEGKFPEEMSALYVLDSIRKLVPEGFFDKVTKAATGTVQKDRRGKEKKIGFDGAGGRAGQIKALYNAAWLDELTALLDDCGAGFLAVTRETKSIEIKWGAPEETIKTQGGTALYYDASYVMRVERDAFVYDTPTGGYETDAPVVGEKFAFEFEKTKVAGRKERRTIGHFHSSNGKLSPEGFDRPRDVLELAERFEIVRMGGGGWMSWGKQRLAQGRSVAIARLWKDGDVLNRLEAEVRERFANVEPVEAEEAEA